MRRKLFAVMLTLGLVTSLVACSGENKSSDEKVYVVGISQFAQHGSLENCKEGFIDDPTGTKE